MYRKEWMTKILLVIVFSIAYVSMNAQDTIRKFRGKNLDVVATEFVIDNETKKPNGFFKVYFEDGTLKEHKVFKKGLLWNIILLKNTDREVINDIGTLENGTGTVKVYNEENNLKTIATYKDGILHGESIKYYNSGQIAMKGNYFDGSRCGKWYRYDKKGNLKENGEREFKIDCQKGQLNRKYRN